MNKFVFTSESVTEGHPDKMADQISDAVVDAIFENDPEPEKVRVACESLLTTGLVVVAGEITCSSYVDIPEVVRATVRDIGYTRAKYGFDAETCSVITSIHGQSPDIAGGVNTSLEVRDGDVLNDELEQLGAGDQGMMFGYACRETKELMPLPIHLSHRLAHRLATVRKAGDDMSYLRPDAKTQVSVEYENGLPKRIQTILISTQTGPNIDPKEQLLPDLKEHVIKPVLDDVVDGLEYDLEVDYKNIRYLANPSGKFEIGGPMGDTGLTGRKIIVDTYGGAARHGGGCFSGKDPTKVDRSAAYYARYMAKNIVAAGLSDRCEIQLAYAIGKSEPVSIMVETFGTEKVSLEVISKLVQRDTGIFDARPGAIIRDLDLRRPIYRKTAAYGHFGRREGTFTWEQMNKVDAVRSAAGL